MHSSSTFGTAHLARFLAMAALVFSGAAPALESGTTALGVRYVSGGVSDGERTSLQAITGQYSLWVITAAARTGAYLADARLRVEDSQGRRVFDARLDGPWLLIDLPLGRYELEAIVDGQAKRHTTTIHPGDRHQAIFYFDIPADVRPRP